MKEAIIIASLLVSLAWVFQTTVQKPQQLDVHIHVPEDKTVPIRFAEDGVGFDCEFTEPTEPTDYE